MKKTLPLFILFYLIFFNPVFTQNLIVSGEVLQHNGDPISNVTVTCSNGMSVLTDINGSFSFSELTAGNDYEINAFYDDIFYDGLTVLDAAYLRYMLLEAVDHSNAQWLSADFNQNGSVTPLDYIGLSRGIVKLENPSFDYPWRFFDSEVDSMPSTINTGINLDNLSSNIDDLKLIGVKSGNILFEDDHVPPPPSAPQPIFYMPDVALVEAEEITISIKARDLEGIVGWQHAMTWDTSYLEFISYNQSSNFDNTQLVNEEKGENGLLRMMGVNISTNPIEDDATIYEIRFNALQNASSLLDLINFDTLAMANQLVYVEDVDFYLIEAKFNIGVPSTTATEDLTDRFSFNLSPNPAREYLNFSIQLPQSATSFVSLYDATGKLIQRTSFNTQFINSEINVGNLPKGIYHLQLQTESGYKSQPFIKL